MVFLTTNILLLSSKYLYRFSTIFFTIFYGFFALWKRKRAKNEFFVYPNGGGGLNRRFRKREKEPGSRALVFREF